MDSFRRRLLMTARAVTGNYVDLSMRNITGGTLSNRETANCYVISAAGDYMFPLVYGCAITGGSTNAASYTRATPTTYTQPFYNYKNTQITSPYIETDTNTQATSAQVIQYDSTGYTISNISIVNGSPCRFLQFSVTNVPTLGGNAIIAIKDSSGNIMWSWHIWAYPFTLSTKSWTNSNNYTYNILDVNLGWVKQSSTSKYGTSPYYQWGRKDPLLRSGATSGMFVSGECATSMASVIQNPTTFNNYETTNYNWWNNNGTAVNFYNYWDADITSTGYSDKVVNKTVYDPSPVGFSIPCGNAFLGCSTSNGGVWDSGWTWGNNYFFAAGCRVAGDGGIYDAGTNGYCWLASSRSQQHAYHLYFSSSGINTQGNNYRAYGFSVRPVART